MNGDTQSVADVNSLIRIMFIVLRHTRYVVGRVCQLVEKYERVMIRL